MEKKKEYRSGGHVLAIPYPSQGHINPLLQFCKQLSSKGLKTTLATTIFISKTFKPDNLLSGAASSVQLDTISDGFDDGGFADAEGVADYLSKLEAAGSKSLAELILKYKEEESAAIDCIVYDSFLPWALEVAKEFGIATSAAFFTQACTVNYVYYCVHHGLLHLPIPPDNNNNSIPPLSHIPGLHFLHLRDMPSFICVEGSYPAYFQMVLTQFSNAHKADFLLCNTVSGFEQEAVECMSKVCPSMLTIGPTIPFAYLNDNQKLKDDREYGLNLFESEARGVCMEWLNKKPAGSVVYVSFGSMANLSGEQIEEVAMGLKASKRYFLWVIRPFEQEKLPDKFVEETAHDKDKGLLVKWCPQLEVLANEAVGCFFTHCGWNSVMEGLSLGVPMVAMPQWTDQFTDAKLVEAVWKVGVRVDVDDNGIVGRQEIDRCITHVMEGETAKQFKFNANKWRNVAIHAIAHHAGSSNNNIDRFISKLLNTSPRSIEIEEAALLIN